MGWIWPNLLQRCFAGTIAQADCQQKTRSDHSWAPRYRYDVSFSSPILDMMLLVLLLRFDSDFLPDGPPNFHRTSGALVLTKSYLIITRCRLSSTLPSCSAISVQLKRSALQPWRITAQRRKVPCLGNSWRMFTKNARLVSLCWKAQW